MFNGATTEQRIAFNSEIEKALKGLKRKGLASSVTRGYKGTGGQAHKRQVWIRLDTGLVDVFLETGYARIGGVISHGFRTIPFEGLTPDQISAKIEEGLIALNAVRQSK